MASGSEQTPLPLQSHGAFWGSANRRPAFLAFLLIGLILFASLNFIFNVILPTVLNNYEYYQLGNYSIIFLIGLLHMPLRVAS